LQDDDSLRDRFTKNLTSHI